MQDELSFFVGAANEAIKPDFRAGTWRVWESYDVIETEGDDAYIIAKDNADDEEYRPLVQAPALFLEFARLADEGEITQEIWLDWVGRYGALGLEWRNPNDIMLIGHFGPVCQEGGPNESYRNFVKEAKRANWLLRLRESIASPEGPDYASFIREAYEIRELSFRGQAQGMSVDKAKVWAIRVMWEEVQEQIRECYPTVLRAEGRFVQGWGFHSLISAMYLQMMWLLTATGEEIRWCSRPECSKVIAYEQPRQPVNPGFKKNDRSGGYKVRSDKIFCTPDCKGKYHYHYVKKPREQNSAL